MREKQTGKDCSNSSETRSAYTQAASAPQMIAEPDVALTDYGLFFESCLFCFWIHRRNRSHPLTRWFLLLFSSIALAAALGGTVHGFLTDPHSGVRIVVWYGTMILLGVTGLSEFGIAAHLLLPPRAARFLILAAVGMFALYLCAVLFWSAEFRIAILDYVVGLVFLCIAFVCTYLRTGVPSVALGAAGLLVSVLASRLQQAHVSLHPRYFNHNALYHVLQAVALFFIYRSARALLMMPSPPQSK